MVGQYAPGELFSLVLVFDCCVDCYGRLLCRAMCILEV